MDKIEFANSHENSGFDAPPASPDKESHSKFGTIIEDDEPIIPSSGDTSEDAPQRKVPSSPEMEFEDPFDDEPIGEGELSGDLSGEAIRKSSQTTSKWIYVNAEKIVPQVCHNYSKIDDTFFLKNIEDETRRKVVVATINDINDRNREKFTWGELHETNIKEPLEEYLQEVGAEIEVPAWMRLFIGLIIVGFITYTTFMDVKKHNEILVDKMIQQLNITKEDKKAKNE